MCVGHKAEEKTHLPHNKAAAVKTMKVT